MPLDPQYTFARAADEVLLRMGRRNDNHFVERVNDWLNSAQYRIVSSYIEVPDLEDTLTLNITEDVNEYDLRTTSPPLTDIVGLKWLKYEKTGYRLRRFSWDEYQNMVNQAHGDPMRWARRGYVLAFDPIPNESGFDVTIQYRRNPQYGVLELDTKWHESVIKLAVSYGWSALMEHERSRAVVAELPALLQMAVNTPLDQYMWESAFDPDLGIRPMSWGL